MPPRWGLPVSQLPPHGLRRGLHSCAASRLCSVTLSTSCALLFRRSRLDGRDARPSSFMKLLLLQSRPWGAQKPEGIGGGGPIWACLFDDSGCSEASAGSVCAA